MNIDSGFHQSSAGSIHFHQRMTGKGTPRKPFEMQDKSCHWQSMNHKISSLLIGDVRQVRKPAAKEM